MPNNYLDQQLAVYIAPNRPEIQKIIRRLSSELFKGHSCIQLDKTEQAELENFEHSGIVLENDRLYLKRYAQYETQLAQRLLSLANTVQAPSALRTNSSSQSSSEYSSESSPKSDIAKLFSDPHQAKAAQLALNQSLAIITGGPGTGKTTTVVKILALLLEQNPKSLMTLCAPTGKAAMRLQASISGSKNHLSEFAESTLDKIPEKVLTIHRLLGARPFSTEFKHHSQNPLLADVVVVDEASMIDLALMTKLLEALPPHAKLILLGDKDQLASVESGAVLADCYEALESHRVELQTTYRFGGKIKQLADAVNRGDTDLALNTLQQAEANDPITWLNQENDALKSWIKKQYQAYFEVIKSHTKNQQQNLTENTPQTENPKNLQIIKASFAAFHQFQILASSHHGIRGVANLNQLCEGLLSPPKTNWYCGRPVMITRNDSNVGLFNGDIGLCLPSAEHHGELRVFFESDQTFKSFPTSRIPEHQTAFAMTIHKSQGSEFAKVFIVLPDQINTQQTFMTKELLYTAITRGKEHITIQAPVDVLKHCISQKVDRLSGLKQKLQTAPNDSQQPAS